MVIDYLNEITYLYDNIENDKEMNDLVNDIKSIDNMINKGLIDNKKISEILNKYEGEIILLSNLEQLVNNRHAVTRNNLSSKDYLYSIKYTLVRVGLIKLSKNKGKEIIKDKLVGNNKEVYEQVCQIILN